MARFQTLLDQISAPPPSPVEDEFDPDNPDTDESGEFDPSAHSIKDVLAYIEAHQDDAERVRAAESAGKARKGILDQQA